MQLGLLITCIYLKFQKLFCNMLRLIKHEYKNHGIRPFMLDLSIAMFIVANSLAWVLPVSSSPLVIVVLFVFLLFLFGSKLRIQSFKPMYIVVFSLLLFVEAFIRIGFSDFWRFSSEIFFFVCRYSDASCGEEKEKL